jgi:hypothetical protein
MVFSRSGDHRWRTVEAGEHGSRPSASKHCRAVTRTAAQVHHAARRIECDACRKVNGRLRALGSEFEILVTVPGRHGKS